MRRLTPDNEYIWQELSITLSSPGIPSTRFDGAVILSFSEGSRSRKNCPWATDVTPIVVIKKKIGFFKKEMGINKTSLSINSSQT